MREAPLQDRIAAVRERLTPAERKVAEFVAADTAAVTGATVASVARAVGVSEPTVIRFCRAIGLEGFSDLRLSLVRAEAGAARPRARPVAGLPPEAAPAAVLDGAVVALEAARRGVDGALYARAALALLRASRIEIWAAGGSFAAARHLEAALLGLCRGVAARDDAALQALAAASLDGEAVALCLSRSGAERDMAEAARIAGAAGATVIALTRARSPLAAAATLLLPCEAPEAEAEGNPAAIVQIALAEALAATVALLAPPAAPRADRLAEARRGRLLP